jgi:hypothetical protein
MGGFRNNVSAIDLEKPFPGDVDIPRLNKGHVGGFFWYVFRDRSWRCKANDSQVCLHGLPKQGRCVEGLHQASQPCPVSFVAYSICRF